MPIVLKNPNGSFMNYTGCGFKCQVRDATGNLIADFNVAPSRIYPNVVDPSPADGLLYVFLPRTVTIVIPPGDYVYDLWIDDSSGSNNQPYFSGNVTVNANITSPDF